MAIYYGYHEGNRSEYMALYALSALGFAVPVSRQSDSFNIDLIVHLASKQGRAFVPTGPSFGVQIKSSMRPLKFETERQRKSLYDLNLPFFLGIVNRREQTLSIYSTLTRLCYMWGPAGNKPFSLIPGRPGENVPLPNEPAGEVKLGGPILIIDLRELDSRKGKQDMRSLFWRVMSYWVTLENDSLSRRVQGVPVVLWQEEHSPNQVPSQNKQHPWWAANPRSFPNITRAVQIALSSYGFYVRDTLRRVPRLPLPPSCVEALTDLGTSIDAVFKASVLAGAEMDKVFRPAPSSAKNGPDPAEASGFP